jgi:hypothetical protein
MEGWILAILGIILIVLIARAQPTPQRTRSTPNQYGYTAVTDENIEVKSYSEKQLADYFSANNIRYEYEPDVPIYAQPDFYLPDYDVYVEFWGLVDAEDTYTRMNYEQQMRRKMARYHNHGYKFISIYPSNLDNLDWVFRKKFENTTGVQLPKVGDLYNWDGVHIDLDYRTCENCGVIYDRSVFSKCPQCGSTRFYYKKI